LDETATEGGNMAPRGWNVLLLFLLLLSPTYIGAAAELFYTYSELVNMQKQPEKLQEASREYARSLAFHPELLISSSHAEQLGWRIHKKIALSAEFSLSDPLFVGVLRESPAQFLQAVQDAPATQTFQDYLPLVPLLDFLTEDFSKLLDADPFSLDSFRPYFPMYRFPNYTTLLPVTNETINVLGKELITLLEIDPQALQDDDYTEISRFGGERFLRNFETLVRPYLAFGDEQQFRASSRWMNVCMRFAQGLDTENWASRMDPWILKRSTQVDAYFRLKDSLDILSRRIITSSDEAFRALLPTLASLLGEYQATELPKEVLQRKVEDVLKNFSDRHYALVEKQLPASSYASLSTLQLSPATLQNSLNLFLQRLEGKPDALTTLGEGSVSSFSLQQVPLWLWIALPSLLLCWLFSRKLRAWVFSLLHLQSAALSHYRKLSNRHPEKVDYHIRIAQLLEQLHREEEAVKEYQIASRLLDFSERAGNQGRNK